MKIALISATWHADILEGALFACKETIRHAGVFDDVSMAEFVVPGCLEIPLFAQKLAQSGEYSAIIAFGLIVDAGIYRHEFVADAVLSGMMRVQLDTGVPIFSCVLTPHQFDESEERITFFRDHLIMKGKEVGNASMKMLAQLQKV